MYAVIETGGKQYRVEVGTELEVELLDVEAGQTITLDRVLLVADGEHAAIGQPTVAEASVAADVVRQVRGQKVISFKYRPKARRRVTRGHRQELTLLRISDIVLGGRSAAADVRAAEEAAKSDRERVEEAARRQAAADAELAAQLAAKAPAKEPAKAPAKAPGKAATKPARSRPAQEVGKPAPGAAPKARAAKSATPEQPATTKSGTGPRATPKASPAPEAEADSSDAVSAGEDADAPKPRRSTRKDG